MEAMLKQTFLQNNKHIVTKSEKHNWKLCRSRYPNRIKSKGQAVVMERNVQVVGLTIFRIITVVVPIVVIACKLIMSNGNCCNKFLYICKFLFRSTCAPFLFILATNYLIYLEENRRKKKYCHIPSAL